jgi:geranylgeranylglycerol-phosphate geranylgeranyltransferase
MTSEQSSLGKASALAMMMRLPNCFMMGIAVIIGEFIALESNLLPIPSLLGFITAFTLTGGSMALNDFFDKEVDAVNEPQRPIPKGVIKPVDALYLAGILATVGMASAVVTGFYISSPWVVVIATLALILASYYNAVGKRWGFAGNLMVSGTVAVPFIYGAFIVGIIPTLLLTTFASMAFLANTGREIIKGIADVAGDKVRKVRTLAITQGCKAASYHASFFYAFAVVLSFIPLSSVSALYIPIVAVADIGFIYTGFSIVRNSSAERARKMKKFSLLWMLLGLVAFIAGVLPLMPV